MADTKTTLRDRLREALLESFHHWITAEWICCDPPKKGHKLCGRGHAALRMVEALLADNPAEHPERSPVLDAVLAVLLEGTSPLTPERVAEIRAMYADYRQRCGRPGAFRCCSAHPVADTVPELLDAFLDAAARVSALEEEGTEKMADRFMEQTKLRSIDFRDGMTMDIEPARELVAIWVGCARGMLGQAENYTETPIEIPTDDDPKVTMEVKLAGELERFAFTLQRVGKLTPHQARQVAEQRAQKAEQLITQIRSIAHTAVWNGDGADELQRIIELIDAHIPRREQS